MNRMPAPWNEYAGTLHNPKFRLWIDGPPSGYGHPCWVVVGTQHHLHRHRVGLTTPKAERRSIRPFESSVLHQFPNDSSVFPIAPATFGPWNREFAPLPLEGEAFVQYHYDIDFGSSTFCVAIRAETSTDQLHLRGAVHQWRSPYNGPTSWDTMGLSWGGRRFEIRTELGLFRRRYQSFCTRVAQGTAAVNADPSVASLLNTANRPPEESDKSAS